MKPILLIEVNEVPNVVLDAYARRSPFMKAFLEKCDRYETVCADQIQLDPWIAWPSFHRGVNDQAHGILRLGQDTSVADAKYPPVWRVLADKGVSTGVYGSLFSSAEVDHGPYRFFVPDVFSPHDEVKPASLKSFQAFNLQMTRNSARNADKKIAGGGYKSILENILSGRISIGTCVRMAMQIVSEKLDPVKVSRRRNTQTEIHADIFASLIEKERPQFATFYTNNVAAAMHRFWSASMREVGTINGERLSDAWVDAYSDEVFVALESVERLLKRLMSGPYKDATIVIASAIGQEEIPAENHASFVTISDLDAFVSAAIGEPGKPVRYETVPTMVPDFTLRFENVEDAERMNARLRSLTIGDQRAVETLERMTAKELVTADGEMAHIRHAYDDSTHFKHAITYFSTDARTIHLSMQIDDYAGAEKIAFGNDVMDFHAAGIGRVSHDEGVNCTAQHCAEGSMLVYGASKPHAGIQRVSALDFAPSLLAHFGAEAPRAYMKGKPGIRLG
ncbi:MAG: alkaline phosphatase family protein [Alphaproteobacteria bacterium]|nr:alkaline phosphatase family protein [Alphaproteobacteria bacterium]